MDRLLGSHSDRANWEHLLVVGLGLAVVAFRLLPENGSDVAFVGEGPRVDDGDIESYSDPIDIVSR